MKSQFHTFELGQTCITPACLEAVPPEWIPELLRRHAAGDYGRIDPEDIEANNQATRTREGRVVSAYHLDHQITVNIITEQLDREQNTITTVLLASDY